MDSSALDIFCRKLPKVELHAHLNGSLSHSTLLELKRYHADNGIADTTNTFFDEFQIGAGDTRCLSDCFQVFSIAHALTSTPKALSIATRLTLQEFQDDGCCYLELRSTPRDTPHITKRQYIDTIVQAIKEASANLTIIAKLIISINRSCPISDAEEISDLAIECYTKYPDVVVGIELSGNPTVGNFTDFVPSLEKARKAGLKVTLHCGEVCNPKEVLEMIQFKPERIGHGIFIHPRVGGTEETWNALCQSKIPVEVCLTSNVNTKLILNYENHHLKELLDAGIPVILCTDDKGVFATSLSQEYRLCAETFSLQNSQLAQISLNASQYIFEINSSNIIKDKILNFMHESNITPKALSEA